MKYNLLILLICIVAFSCDNTQRHNHTPEQQAAVSSIIVPDSTFPTHNSIVAHLEQINLALKAPIPIRFLVNPTPQQLLAQQIASTNKQFTQHLFDAKSKQPLRNEIFNVYEARPQELPNGSTQGNVYKVELYNYALNLTTTALVDITTQKVLQVNILKATQPDIPLYLKELATQMAIHHPEVIKALGYKPGQEDALMASTKTALNQTRCERSLHLCVAPTFTQGDKALWVIVDLTDLKIVGLRWTYTGTEQPSKKVTEKRLKFDKIMECYCKQINKIERANWQLNYVITTSDGLRISEVTYKNQLVINNAKVVDWHVSYSNTDGFGYSDAVGCPEYSQAAVVAESEPRISDIIQNGQIVGFALEQTFSSEQWPEPCNYNYLQRYEFYTDGRFRSAAASLGRGCGNNGTYRPVMRFSFPGNSNTFSEWNGTAWSPWKHEQWKLQTPQTLSTPEGYQYAIMGTQHKGFYIQSGKGQFGDGGRGDNPYVYVTQNHPDIDEGENDLVTIGPCCNTDYQQGPEKFINGESIENKSLVLWYVCQMKNDDTEGKEYCWAERYLEHGVYKTKIFPCLAGPMFVPISK